MCIPCRWRHRCLAFSLCAWQSGAWCSERRWKLAGFSAGSRERCNRSILVEIKGRASEHCASEPSTAGHSRMQTNEPHMSKPERRIETVFQTGRGLQSTSDVSRLLSRNGLACCCAETKLLSFKLNDKRSPRGASGASHQRAGSTLPWSATVTGFAQVTTQWPVSHRSKETLFDFQHRCSRQTIRGKFRTESSNTPSVVSARVMTTGVARTGQR